jgi:hypothetical protein
VNIKSLITRSTLAVAAVGAISLIALVTLSNQSARRAIMLATTHQPERFTELYFNNHQLLPTQIPAGKPITFSYHVTNHEAGPVVYYARVSIVANGKVELLKYDTVTLADGEGRDRSVVFTESLPNQNLQLIVELPNQSQSIYFRTKT